MFEDAIFLDVGAHMGQTLQEVTRPKYQFRTIYAFEPMPQQYNHVERSYRGGFPNVQVFDYGLGERTETVTIYGANEHCESSMFADKNDVSTLMQTNCTIVEASNWFERHLTEEDTVIMKINAEGAEVHILNNLVDSGQIWRIHNVMIDWDCRKVPSLAHCEQDILARFREIGFDRYSLCDDVMRGATHQSRIGNWLSTVA